MNWDSDAGDRYSRRDPDLITDACYRLIDEAAPELLTQRREIIEELIGAASDLSLREQYTVGQFEFLADRCIDLVNQVSSAVARSTFAEPNDESPSDIWEHQQQPMRLVLENKAPLIYRQDVEQIVSDYLELPVRSRKFERLLADIMVAMELFAFGREMYVTGAGIKGVAPPSSPIFQRHPLTVFFVELVVVAVGLAIIVGCAVAAEGLIGSNAVVIVSMIGAVAALGLIGIALVRLPLQWRHQRTQKARVVSLINAMIETYHQLPAEGMISTRRVREVAQKACDNGVGWPGPLFALLDDNIQRDGKL